MWAGYIALANQQLAENGGATTGFINPAIYAQNFSGGSLTAVYAADLHGINSGTSGSYSAQGFSPRRQLLLPGGWRGP
jgi:kumamolisin